MGQRKTARRYYDSHAHTYDQAYDTPYWRLVHAVIRQRIRAALPRRHPCRVADLGAGTGLWGLELARGGLHVTLLDISERMLEVGRRKAAALGCDEARLRFVRGDVCDLSALEAGSFDLAVAVGDVLSFCHDADAALREIARILVPGAWLVATVDNRAAGLDAYLEQGDVAGLEALLAHGTTEWLAHRTEERFAVHAFDPDEVERLFARRGFAEVSVRGLTVLPLRRYQTLLDDPATARRLLRLEGRLSVRRDLLGRASHLLVGARRPDS